MALIRLLESIIIFMYMLDLLLNLNNSMPSTTIGTFRETEIYRWAQNRVWLIINCKSMEIKVKKLENILD